MRLLACLIVAPQRGYDEPTILSYAISSFCPTSADGLHPGTTHPRSRLADVRSATESGQTADMSLCPLCAKADICSAANCGLFDYLVGGREQRRGHCEAERLGSFEVDHQLE